MSEKFIPQEAIVPKPVDEAVEEAKFHFEEMEQIAQNAEEMVAKLKENIDNGKYNVLISDEAGGRIPTLLLKKVINKIHPELPLHTYFVSGGSRIKKPENSIKFFDRLADIKRREPDASALLVTQFINTGESLHEFINALQYVGISNLDVAALSAPSRYSDGMIGERVGFYKADRTVSLPTDENHEHLSGVRKTVEYRSYPETYIQSIEHQGREMSMEEWREVYGVLDDDPPWVVIEKSNNNPEADEEFERRKWEPLTDEEKAEMYKNIRLVREDIDTLANQVVKKVWDES